MIAQRRRTTALDTVLVFFSVFVLVSLLAAPRGQRQIVEVDSGDGETLTYWADPDHTDLSRIRARLDHYGKPTQHRLLGMNLWIAETSRVYAAAAESLWADRSPQPTIQQVSHQIKPVPHQAAVVGWSRIANEADLRIAQMNQHQSQRLQQLAPPPVKLGPVVSVPWTWRSLSLAGSLAILAVMILMLWQYVSPTLTISELEHESESSDVEKSSASHRSASHRSGAHWMPVQVLPQWIDLHQSIGCHCRRVVMAGLSIAAIACVLAKIIAA